MYGWNLGTQMGVAGPVISTTERGHLGLDNRWVITDTRRLE